jgi:hypothetical protein
MPAGERYRGPAHGYRENPIMAQEKQNQSEQGSSSKGKDSVLSDKEHFEKDRASEKIGRMGEESTKKDQSGS